MPKLPKEDNHCPSLAKLKVSKPNVEKVVKLPKIPTKIKARHSGEKSWRLSMSPPPIPINRQPTTFTVMVPKGKVAVFVSVCTAPATRYRRMAPMHPPIPMNKILSISISLSATYENHYHGLNKSGKTTHLF